MSPHLALHLLGPPKLEYNHKTVAVHRRKTLALLAYLAVNRGPQPREFLSAMFWPDYDQARAFTNLRHALWETQQVVGEGWIIADRETIRLNEDTDPAEDRLLWLDIACFDSLIRESQAQKDPLHRIRLLSESVDLYRGHFLAGFSLKNALNFTEWAAAHSDTLRRQLAGALTALAGDYCAVDQAESAIPHAQRLIALDPLNEASHRLSMQIYTLAGQPNAALKQYQACEKILRRELGIDPQPETRALFKQIRKGEFNSIQPFTRTELPAPKHNLPFQVSTFVGRTKELREIRDLIAGHRLVTLIGAGGIGKTRLSLMVGEGLVHDYAGGVWLVELASLHDPNLVVQSAAKLFNLIEGSGEPLIEKLIRVLHPKTILLVLDNCEHVLTACAKLADSLLRNCPNLRILATSREALSIPGEALYHVPSLVLPGAQQPVEDLLEYESIQLFDQRARLVQENFTLTMENATSIAQICRHLDGIPLAIELAAARVNVFSAEQISARLDESFGLLTGGNRTTLPRHQTLRASIDWSWELLSGSEQTLLRRLAVFAGGWTLDAAVAVCAGEGLRPNHVLEALTHLVAKSLVVVNLDSGGERRYYLLETIRQYARLRVQDLGEMQALQHRHLDYFFKLAGQAEAELTGPGQTLWMKQLEDDLDNIRAALDWSLNDREPRVEAGLKMAESLWWFWYMRGHAEEGGDWLEKTLALNADPSPADPVIRAKGLTRLGHLRINITYVEEGLALSRTLGAAGKESLAFGLWVLGALAYFYADFARAKSLMDDSLNIFREIGSRWGICETQTWMGAALERLGDHPGASRCFEESLALARQAQDCNEIAWALWNLGTAAMARKNYGQSTRYLEESLARYREMEGYDGVTWLLGALGNVALATGDYEQAAACYAEALVMQRERGNQRGIAECLENMGNAAAIRNQPERAGRLLGAAQSLRESSGTAHYPYQLQEYERFLETLRPQVDEAVLSGFCAEGREMTNGQAIEYALQGA